MSEILSKSIENFSFSFSGNQIYYNETVLPLVISISNIYKKNGVKEIPNKDIKKERFSNNGSLSEAYNQIVILLKDHPIEFEFIKILTEITIINIVEIFRDKKSKNTEMIKDKTKFTVRKKNKEITIEIPWENLTNDDVYKKTSEIATNVLKTFMNN